MCQNLNKSNLTSRSISFGIVGYGQFGRFIHDLLRQHEPNCSVTVFTTDRAIDVGAASSLMEVAACNIIFLAVPISSYSNVVSSLIPFVNPETVLVDVATVKVHTTRILERSDLPCKFISTHPMFGPESYKKIGERLDGLRVVVTGHSLDEIQYDATKRFLGRLGIKVVETDPDQHDRDLAETLFLTHYVGQVIANAGFLRTDIDTVSFGFLMDAVEAVKNDSALFDQVVRYNPYCAQVIEKFDQSDREIRRKMLEQSPANRSDGLWYSY
jgi:prephenate dehydrogenase